MRSVTLLVLAWYLYVSMKVRDVVQGICKSDKQQIWGHDMAMKDKGRMTMSISFLHLNEVECV